MVRGRMLAAAFCALAPPVGAEALPQLSENAYVTDRLVAARVADRIRRTCPTIGARIFRALAEAQALEEYALAQGYSEAEIEDFLDDRAEKQRLYARAEAYLAANGATDTQGFCALGMQEIDRGTIAGSLLRVK